VWIDINEQALDPMPRLADPVKQVVMRELHKLHGVDGLLDGPVSASTTGLGSVGLYNGLTKISFLFSKFISRDVTSINCDLE
jgi:hypothetical protein